MEKEMTRLEKYKDYRKEIDESFKVKEKKEIKKNVVEKKDVKQHTVYDEYRKQKNKKTALYILISSLIALALLVGLILFIVFKGIL